MDSGSVASLLKSGIKAFDSREALELDNGFIQESVYLGKMTDLQWLSTEDEEVVLAGDEDAAQKLAAHLKSLKKIHLISPEELNAAFEENAIPRDLILRITPYELALDIPFEKDMVILDVRKLAAFEAGHVSGAVHFPMADLADIAMIASFETHEVLYIYGNDDEDATIAATVFKAHSGNIVKVVAGGFDSLKNEEKISIEEDAPKPSLN